MWAQQHGYFRMTHDVYDFNNASLARSEKSLDEGVQSLSAFNARQLGVLPVGDGITNRVFLAEFGPAAEQSRTPAEVAAEDARVLALVAGMNAELDGRRRSRL